MDKFLFFTLCFACVLNVYARSAIRTTTDRPKLLKSHRISIEAEDPYNPQDFELHVDNQFSLIKFAFLDASDNGKILIDLNQNVGFMISEVEGEVQCVSRVDLILEATPYINAMYYHEIAKFDSKFEYAGKDVISGKNVDVWEKTLYNNTFFRADKVVIKHYLLENGGSAELAGYWRPHAFRMYTYERDDDETYTSSEEFQEFSVKKFDSLEDSLTSENFNIEPCQIQPGHSSKVIFFFDYKDESSDDYTRKHWPQVARQLQATLRDEFNLTAIRVSSAEAQYLGKQVAIKLQLLQKSDILDSFIGSGEFEFLPDTQPDQLDMLSCAEKVFNNEKSIGFIHCLDGSNPGKHVCFTDNFESSTTPVPDSYSQCMSFGDIFTTRGHYLKQLSLTELITKLEKLESPVSFSLDDKHGYNLNKVVA